MNKFNKKQIKTISITFFIIGGILALSGLEEFDIEGGLYHSAAIPLVLGILFCGLGLFIWQGNYSKTAIERRPEMINEDMEKIKNEIAEKTLLYAEKDLTEKILSQSQSHFSKSEIFSLVKSTLSKK